MTGATDWAGFDPVKDTVTKTRITDLMVGGDDSVIMYGRMENGLIQTEGCLAAGPQGDRYLAVFGPGMDELRFSTWLPGTGSFKTMRAGRNTCGESSFARIRSRVIKGRLWVLVCSSATKETTPACSGNALQPLFGGGESDGYYVVLEGEALPKQPVAKPSAGTFVEPIPQPWPAQLPRYIMDGEHPPFQNAALIFRDAANQRWPGIFLAKAGTGGELTWDGGKLHLNATIEATRLMPAGNEPSRTIIGTKPGEKPTAPKVTVLLSGHQTWRQDGPSRVSEMAAEVTIDEKKVALSGTIRILPVQVTRWWTPRRDRDPSFKSPEPRNSLQIRGNFHCKGSQLGLTEAANTDIEFEVITNAYPEGGQAEPVVAGGNQNSGSVKKP
ncbi:MAG: hypothetical protein ABSH20_29545 [Tepidisphaeraceae bacterium]